jgi:hypothetical protein
MSSRLTDCMGGYYMGTGGYYMGTGGYYESLICIAWTGSRSIYMINGKGSPVLSHTSKYLVGSTR